MTDLKSMTPEELTAWCREQGQPAFRGRQLFQWLSRGVVSTQEMTDLPKALRAKIDQEGGISPPSVERKQVSKLDGTIKYLWRLSDGNCIETVLMRYRHGNSVCISSQVGCAMGCAFCASTVGAGPQPDGGRTAGPGHFYPERFRCPHLQHCSDGDWGAVGQL